MVAIVTGASSGFGKSIYETLKKNNFKVYGTSRFPGKFPGNDFMELDLENETSIKKFAEEILRKEKNIDVLVNNAGIDVSGPIEFTDLSLVNKQFQVNFFGHVSLTQKILPNMRERSSGTIINISSVGGLMGLPFHGFYSASKFAMEGFTEALRLELLPFNIRVYNVNPGDFKTNITQNRIYSWDINDASNPYHSNYKRTMELCAKTEQAGPDPSLVAKKVYRLITSSPKSVRYVIGKPDQKFSYALKRLLPSWIFEKMMKGYYKIR